jgi:hypothetical protein
MRDKKKPTILDHANGMSIDLSEEGCHVSEETLDPPVCAGCIKKEKVQPKVIRMSVRISKRKSFLNEIIFFWNSRGFRDTAKHCFCKRKSFETDRDNFSAPF